MLGALGTHALGAIEIKAVAVVEVEPPKVVQPVQIETAITALKETADVMREAVQKQERRSTGLRIRA